MFLLDTNVVAELRRAASGKADASVVAWAASIPATLQFISAMTVFELDYGVRLTENSDPCKALFFAFGWTRKSSPPSRAERCR